MFTRINQSRCWLKQRLIYQISKRIHLIIIQSRLKRIRRLNYQRLSLRNERMYRSRRIILRIRRIKRTFLKNHRFITRIWLKKIRKQRNCRQWLTRRWWKKIIRTRYYPRRRITCSYCRIIRYHFQNPPRLIRLISWQNLQRILTQSIRRLCILKNALIRYLLNRWYGRILRILKSWRIMVPLMWSFNQIRHRLRLKSKISHRLRNRNLRLKNS